VERPKFTFEIGFTPTLIGQAQRYRSKVAQARGDRSIATYLMAPPCPSDCIRWRGGKLILLRPFRLGGQLN